MSASYTGQDLELARITHDKIAGDTDACIDCFQHQTKDNPCQVCVTIAQTYVTVRAEERLAISKRLMDILALGDVTKRLSLFAKRLGRGGEPCIAQTYAAVRAEVAEARVRVVEEESLGAQNRAMILYDAKCFWADRALEAEAKLAELVRRVRAAAMDDTLDAILAEYEQKP